MGSATTHGVPALEHSLPSRDAPVVARMKAAGAIVLGRTNLPEFALRLSTDNPLRGSTLNPWNPYLTPGGSSGGDAAALATGMTPFGLGNDIGGSLRNPAYCCGVAALKPTVGRIPRAGSIPPLDWGMATQLMAVEGPMARSVADLRLGLSVLAGRDIRDPRSVDVPLQGPAPVARRAALVTRIPGVEIPPETVAEIQRAGRILAGAGWEVESAEPPELELVTETWLDVLSIDFSVLMPRIRSLITRPVYDYVMALCRMSDARDKPNSEIHATRSRLTRLWSGFFAQYPGRDRADVDPAPVAGRRRPRTGDRRAVGAGHSAVHHPRQRAGAAIRSAADRGGVWPADRDTDLRRPVARGPLFGGSRDHRGRRRPAHAHRSAPVNAGARPRPYIGGAPAGRGISQPWRTTAAITPNMGCGTGCTSTSSTAGPPLAKARSSAGLISATDSTRSP